MLNASQENVSSRKIQTKLFRKLKSIKHKLLKNFLNLNFEKKNVFYQGLSSLFNNHVQFEDRSSRRSLDL